MTRSALDAVRRAIPPAVAALLDAVLAEAERRELGVHLVGGPVRDLLLERGIRDVDLIVEPRDAASGTAEDLARAAAPVGADVVGHGRFGTVRIGSGDAVLDLATLRRETYARAGALPVVEPGSLDEDLQRRDFSVNAMAVPLSTAARRGRPAVIDLAGGREDLAARVLRVLHPQSFLDDPTRALRAARLAARLGFRLARPSRSALRDAISAGAFGSVSGDRYRREFEKLFEDARLGVDPALALALLAEWHVLGALEPGLALPAKAVAALRRLGRSIAEAPQPGPRTRVWVAGLAVWLAELDATSRRRALRRLSVRGETAQRIAAFPKLRDRILRSLARARGRGAVDALLAPIEDEERLALFASAPPALRRRMLRWTLEDRGRRPPISGSDLVAAGLVGPAVGAALARVRIAWLDGAVRTRDEALALAREVGARIATRTAARRKHVPTAARAAAKPAALPDAEASPILPAPSLPKRVLRPERQA